MHRAKAKISALRPASTMSTTACWSCGETIGMPASIRSTPALSRRRAIASLSSGLKATPACCSPSRSVTSWNRTFGWKSRPSRAAGSWFQGLVKNLPGTSQGLLLVIRPPGSTQGPNGWATDATTSPTLCQIYWYRSQGQLADTTVRWRTSQSWESTSNEARPKRRSSVCGGFRAPPPGFEPGTCGLEVRCSIQLS